MFKDNIPTYIYNLFNKIFKRNKEPKLDDPVGDAFSTVAVDTLNIQPVSGYEWIIHNIYHGTDSTLNWVSSTNTIKVDTDPGEGIWAKYSFHVTNSVYIRITSAGTISADGIVSKVP